MQPVLVEEVASIKPRYSVVYRIWHNIERTTKRPKANKRNGEISRHSQRRLMQCVDWLITLSIKKRVICNNTGKTFTFKLNFITLTLPAQQIHPDEVIRKMCLEPILRKLRRKCGMVHYVWKAETQKNGNIHFHITTNVFVHYMMIRRWWNSRLYKLGYIQRCKYEDPPTTEVKAVIKEKDIAVYLAKYLAKTEDDRTKPLCKLWDCNNNLKKITFTLNEINFNIAQKEAFIGHIQDAQRVEMEYCIVYKMNKRIEKRNDIISRKICEKLFEIFGLSGQQKVYRVDKLFKVTNEVNYYTE